MMGVGGDDSGDENVLTNLIMVYPDIPKDSVFSKDYSFPHSPQIFMGETFLPHGGIQLFGKLPEKEILILKFQNKDFLL